MKADPLLQEGCLEICFWFDFEKVAKVEHNTHIVSPAFPGNANGITQGVYVKTSVRVENNSKA